MSYTYQFMNYVDAYEDVRGVFGVDNIALSDEVINRITNMPAAELTVLETVTNYDGLSDAQKLKVRLATVYYTAANCYQAVKLNVLKIEDDNKSMRTRFNDAFSVTEEDLRKKAAGLLTEFVTVGLDSNVFELVKPSVDVITGNPYA